MTDTSSTDVAIVGGGPIGLELAIALKRAGVKYLQFEAGQIGSTMAWWAPETRFFSSPERLELAGVPLITPDQNKATREQYLAYLRTVVRQFDLAVRTYERVLRIERLDRGFRLHTGRSLHGVGGPHEAAHGNGDPHTAEHTILADRVVLAIGNLHRPRRLGIPGEDLGHVSHFFDEPHRYYGGRVLIVGGKNSAVEAALRCHRVGADVTISYRGDAFDPRRVKYWLLPEIEWLIQKQRIGWHPRTAPADIDARGVTLVCTEDGASAPEHVPADHVLLLTGYEQDRALFEQLGLDLTTDDHSPVHDPRTMETSVPGVYAAGTAVGGSQRRTRVFIENSHVHVQRITRALTGRDPQWPCDAEYAALEES